MAGQKLNWAVNVALAISFFSVFLLGVIKLPQVRSFLGEAYFSLPIGTISIVHEYSGIAMGVLVFIHLTLNRKWIMTTTKEIFGGRKNEK